MTIQTKFDIDEEIFFISNNKMKKGKILAIKVSVGKVGQYNDYYLHHMDDPDNYFIEKQLFKTEEELKQSL